MYEIKQLSQEEIDNLRIQFPYTDIQEYQLLDNDMTLGYFSTSDEATLEMRRWEGRDAIRDAIDDKLPYLVDELERMGSWYDIDSAEVRDMLRGSV